MNDSYVPRWPANDSPLNVEYCREIDFNHYELVYDGKYFVRGDTKKERDWFQLKGMINGVPCSRRLYLSTTEIGSMKNFMIDKPNYDLSVYTDLYWPRMFFKDWHPTTNHSGLFKSDINSNVFEYGQIEKQTIIVGLSERPFGVVWNIGGLQVVFDKEVFIRLRNIALNSPFRP